MIQKTDDVSTLTCVMWIKPQILVTYAAQSSLCLGKHKTFQQDINPVEEQNEENL